MQHRRQVQNYIMISLNNGGIIHSSPVNRTSSIFSSWIVPKKLLFLHIYNLHNQP